MPKDKVITCSLCHRCGTKLQLIGTDGTQYKYYCEKCHKVELEKKDNGNLSKQTKQNLGLKLFNVWM